MFLSKFRIVKGGWVANQRPAGLDRGNGMPLNPSKFLHFHSWKQLRQWLPEATESQLLTVFVWAGDQKPPPGDVRWVSEIRNTAFEFLVERTRDRLHRFLVQRCHCHDSHLADDLIQQILIKVYLRGEQ